MSEAANALITDDELPIYKSPPSLTPRKAIRKECRWCGGLGFGMVMCGWCGEKPTEPRRPMAVIITEECLRKHELRKRGRDRRRRCAKKDEVHESRAK